MRTSPRLLLCLLAALAFVVARPALAVEPEHAQPDAAHAAADGHADAHPAKGEVLPTIQQGIVPMIVTIVVFSLVLAILSAKVWPAIVKGLNDRENKIREEIESAQMAREQAKDALEQYQKSLADARAEAQKMLEATRSQQQALAAELKGRADIELNQMRERAMRDIESAKRAAVSEIYSTYSGLATSIAGKILKREITAADNQRLVEESVALLETMKS